VTRNAERYDADTRHNQTTAYLRDTAHQAGLPTMQMNLGDLDRGKPHLRLPGPRKPSAA
jgi:hypothetical protein